MTARIGASPNVGGSAPSAAVSIAASHAPREGILVKIQHASFCPDTCAERVRELRIRTPGDVREAAHKNRVEPWMSKSKTSGNKKPSKPVQASKGSKGSISGVDVASYVASAWSQGKGPLPLHQGVFFHARHCAASSDSAGATAFAAITPKDFWVPLVAAPNPKVGKSMLKPTKAHPELFIDQLVAVAEMVPDLQGAAAEAMVKEIAVISKADGDHRVVEAVQHLMRFEMKLATKAITGAKSLSSPRILVPFIVAMVQAGNLAAAKAAASRLTSLDLLLSCELSQPQWSALIPSLRTAGEEVLGTTDTQQLVDYIAQYAKRGTASLLSKRPSVELARMQWETGHVEVARKTLQGVEGQPDLELMYLTGLISTAKLIEQVGAAGKSSASAWRTLTRVRDHASSGDLKTIDAARAAAVKRGCVTTYDRGVWPEVRIGEAALAVELSDEVGLPTAVADLDLVLKSVAPDDRKSGFRRAVKALLSRGMPEAAVRVLDKASNKPIVMNENEREAAILGFLPRDPAAALKALGKLAPPKLNYTKYSQGRFEYRRNEWALRILEAIPPRV